MISKRKWIAPVMVLALSFIIMGEVCWAEIGVSKDEIKIGATGDLSGPIAFLGAGVRDGAILYFKYINDEGGVYGRKIKYIFEDDGYQAPRAVQAIKKLVTRDKVFCMFMVVGSAQVNATYPFLESRGIPCLLPGTQNRDMAVPPRKYLFLADPTYTTQAKLALEYIVEDMGIKNPKVACIYQDDTPGHDWRNGARIGAKYYGLDLLELPYKRGAVDFSSQMAKCKDAGITHVLMWTLVREPAFIMKEAQRLQYKPTYITSTASITKQILDLAGDAVDYGNGLYATGILHDPLSGDTQGLRQLRKNVAKYKMCDMENFYNAYGYQSGMTLVEGLKRTGRNLTREGLIKALETFKEYDNGLMAPITWGPNRRGGGSAIKIFKAKSGYWKSISDWRFTKIKEE